MSDIVLINATSTHISLPDNSVHVCVTSPPYWGLRLYSGVKPQVFGGDPNCGNPIFPHEWVRQGGGGLQHENRNFHSGTQDDVAGSGPLVKVREEASTRSWVCAKCGAWYGYLGNEPDPGQYVANLVAIFREVWRVLRPDGTLWLNLGDSFAANRSYRVPDNKWGDVGNSQSMRCPAGLKPKDLCMIPARVALALQADGWWVRSAPPWIKKNCMPESVRDRPTTAHESWFMLTKSECCYADQYAVRVGEQVCTRKAGGYHGDIGTRPKDGAYRNKGGMADKDTTTIGRNRRTTDFFFKSLDSLIAQEHAYLRHLEQIKRDGGMLLNENGDPLALVFNTKPYGGAHFATFSPDMIEPLIKFSSSEYGACPTCGSPWERVIDYKANYEKREAAHAPKSTPTKVDSSGWREPTRKQTGWQPTCKCYGAPSEQLLPCPDCEGTGRELEWASNQFRKEEAARTGRKDGKVPGPRGGNVKVETGEPCPACDGAGTRLVKTWPAEKDTWPVVPCVILDPFVGSGTTLQVARSLGRNGVGLDLSYGYLHNEARSRLGLDKLAEWESGPQEKEQPVTLEDLPMFKGGAYHVQR